MLGDDANRDYSAKLRSFNAFAEPEIRALIGGLGLKAGMHVLDAGCGTGEALSWLSSAVEPSAGVVDPSADGGGVTGSPSVASGPNTTDIAWLQLLIAMNERLLPVFDLVASRSGDPAVQLYASVARRRRTEAATSAARCCRTSMPSRAAYCSFTAWRTTTCCSRTARC